MFKKKGQITLFIILGLVLVVIVGLAIYFFSVANSKPFKPSDINVPEQFEPVQDYVTQCVNQIATNGIIKMGLHGGYIDPTDPVLSGVIFNMNTLQQYNSDLAFLISNDKTSGIPYWFYTKPTITCDNCVVATQTPSLYSMEQQLSQYIKRNMQSCLLDFESFKNRGYLITDEYNYTIETAITETGVAVLMQGSIFVSVSEQETTLDMFYTEIDIPLLKYYNIATNITITQIQNNFLENVGLYLINMHSGLDSSKLPPIHDSSDGYDIQLWSKTATKQKFQGLLVSYIPALRILNSKNDAEIIGQNLSPSEYYFYNATRLDIPINEDLSTSEIYFSYLGQDISFDILPSEGELLLPTTNNPKGFSALFEERIINDYNFYYQVSYPVIVEIRDEYKKDSYYTFTFALEGTIIDNLRIRDYFNDSTSPILWDPSLISINYNNPESTQLPDLTSMGLDAQFNTEYSGMVLNSQDFQSPTLTNPDTKFCNANQKVSGLVTLKTYDSITGDPLKDVSVTFGCGNFMECSIGRTTLDTMLQESLLKTKLPTCNAGYIKLTKQGYLTKNILLSTASKNSQNLGSIYLDPIINKTFDVKKYYVSKRVVIGEDGEVQYSVYGIVQNVTTNISENDTIIITLEKMLYDATDEPYGQMIMISNETEISREILLVPGAYMLTIQLLDNAGIIIPKECKTICVDKTFVNSVFGGCNEEKKIPEEDIVIKPAPWGGVTFINQTLIYISGNDLSSDNILEFNIMRLPEPRCLDDMSDMSEVESISEKYSEKLLPKFINNN
ncbi:MAG: hypothetical protein ACP5N1_02365 [Candidatus Woesearchaeota archaeon]